jgi:Uma2 family endonuclease
MTKDEFYSIATQPGFDGSRYELIDGEMREKPGTGNDHSIAVELVRDALSKLFGPNYWVRVQATLDLSPYSVPDPDIAVIHGTPRSTAGKANPTSALLVVEVSDSSIHYDRNRKTSLYASVGITDYWIVNLEDRVLEIRRNPQPDPNADLGYNYSTVITLFPDDFVSPLAAPLGKVEVKDLLP